MALRDMKSDLAIGVGSKQTPQSFTDGHSGTLVTGNKSFDIPPRFDIQTFKISALSRESEQLNFQFNDTFNTPGQSIVDKQVPELQKYYDRAFSQTDPLGARNNSRIGFDEPFVLKAIGDRWGPGGLGAIDFGLVRGGAVTQAARTLADVERIGKFLITPKGVAFVTKQAVLQSMNAGVRERFGIREQSVKGKPLGNLAGIGDDGGMRARKNKNMDLSEQFGNYNPPPSAGFVDGSDVRVWRPTSIIDSLPIGAHAVRHLEPPGLPLSKIVDDLSNFVTKGADELKQFKPGVSVDISGGIESPEAGLKLDNIFSNIKLPKFGFSEPGGLTDFFPSLIEIPTIPTPNFSGLNKILGGLASQAASLAANAAKSALGALGGISIPNLSLPPLPNLKIPALPNIPPIVADVFSGVKQAVEFTLPSLPKFSGTGGLGLGVNTTTNPVVNLKNFGEVSSSPAEAVELGGSQLFNLYSREKNYKGELRARESTIDFDRPQTLSLGIRPQTKIGGKDGGPPIAITAGFEVGRLSTATSNQHLTKKIAHPIKADNSINNQNLHQKQVSHDKLGNRLDRYNLKSYGQLNNDNRYEKDLTNADISRGIGNQGRASRIVTDKDGNIIKVTAGGGGFKNELSDQVNLHPYGGTTADILLNDNRQDFVPLKFRDMVNGKWMIFRAILESVSDTASPDYAEERYIGRPDKVYVYQGATRNVNITFKVMPKSLQELVTLWDKLNYLRGLVYPKIDNNRMVSPFFSFTLGDMFENQPMIFQSLNYAIDTASTWEIKPGIRLPKLINVSADMRVIEDTVPQTTGKHYGLYWLEKNLEHGTFDKDPALPTQRKPARKGWEDLFAELDTIEKETLAELQSGEAAIKAQEALIDELKSDINVSNSDLPIPDIRF